MSSDLSEFHAPFFEECFESIDVMEAGLLRHRECDADESVVHEIFRGAHSIKGGAGMFGFGGLTALTHDMETLLDEFRTGARALVTADLDALLGGVDALREMIASLQGGESDEAPMWDQARSAIGQRQGLVSLEDEPGAGAPMAPPSRRYRYRINFRPARDFLRQGDDPIRILQELRTLGELESELDVSQLPTLDQLDPMTSYFGWTLWLDTEFDEAHLDEVFAWCTGQLDYGLELIEQNQQTNEPIDSLEETGLLARALLSDLAVEPPRLEAEPGRGRPAADDEGRPESVASPARVERAPSEPVSPDLVPSDPAPAGPTEARAPVKASPESPAVPEPSKGAAPQTRTQSAPGQSVAAAQSMRVAIHKVDALINLVGELVITQSMLTDTDQPASVGATSSGGVNLATFDPERLAAGLAALQRNTRELQERVMQLRMLPIHAAFGRLPRLVRDLAGKLDKAVDLQITGEHTELDRTMLESLTDPLVHIVRNSLDHGIESREVRTASGKPETGTLHVSAQHVGGTIVIEVRDDGAGIDTERLRRKAIERGLMTEGEEMAEAQLAQLIFHPGLSTAAEVSDISGRGVGMDVVQRNINALGGGVDVESRRGHGATVRIRLPLTLAIVEGQLASVAGHIYIFPLVSIVESLRPNPGALSRPYPGQCLYRLHDEYIPVVSLREHFQLGSLFAPEVREPLMSVSSSSSPDAPNDDQLMVVVDQGTNKLGVIVDRLLGQQQVVVKSLEQNYRRVRGIAGATILGDGQVGLILDAAGLAAPEPGGCEQAGFDACGSDTTGPAGAATNCAA